MENYTNNFTNNNNKKFYLLRIQKYPIRGSPAARPQANFIPFPSPCCDNRRWRNGGRRRGADHAVDPVTRDRPPRPPVPSVEKGGHVREGGGEGEMSRSGTQTTAGSRRSRDRGDARHCAPA